jgi:hypothetical protein
VRLCSQSRRGLPLQVSLRETSSIACFCRSERTGTNSMVRRTNSPSSIGWRIPGVSCGLKPSIGPRVWAVLQDVVNMCEAALCSWRFTIPAWPSCRAQCSGAQRLYSASKPVFGHSSRKTSESVKMGKLPWWQLRRVSDLPAVAAGQQRSWRRRHQRHSSPARSSLLVGGGGDLDPSDLSFLAQPCAALCTGCCGFGSTAAWTAFAWMSSGISSRMPSFATTRQTLPLRAKPLE